MKSDIEAYTCFVIQVSHKSRNLMNVITVHFFEFFSYLLVNYCQCNLKIVSIVGAHRWEESSGIDIQVLLEGLGLYEGCSRKNDTGGAGRK